MCWYLVRADRKQAWPFDPPLGQRGRWRRHPRDGSGDPGLATRYVPMARLSGRNCTRSAHRTHHPRTPHPTDAIAPLVGNRRKQQEAWHKQRLYYLGYSPFSTFTAHSFFLSVRTRIPPNIRGPFPNQQGAKKKAKKNEETLFSKKAGNKKQGEKTPHRITRSRGRRKPPNRYNQFRRNWRINKRPEDKKPADSRGRDRTKDTR